MAGHPLDPDGAESPDPGGSTLRGEPRWPAALAVLVVIVLHLTLPQSLTVLPDWVVPVILAVLLLPLLVGSPRRHHGAAVWSRRLSLLVLAVLALTLFTSIAMLANEILTAPEVDAEQLIWSAFALWVTSVVAFGLGCWELDGGGPEERHAPGGFDADLLFTQQDRPELAGADWRPTFPDYLYVALTNSMTFGPTDTLPLTVRMKALMGFQSALSLVVIALLAGWAVGSLG